MSEVRIETTERPDRRKAVWNCPRQPGKECYVMLKPWPISDGKAWDCTGPDEAPTLSPSVECVICGWHGFIKNGRLESVS